VLGESGGEGTRKCRIAAAAAAETAAPLVPSPPLAVCSNGKGGRALADGEALGATLLQLDAVGPLKSRR
jgi:hypothetical protein